MRAPRRPWCSMTSSDHTSVLPRELLGVSGVRAVEGLLEQSNGDIQIDATGLRRIDALSAVVLRAAIERFVARRKSNRVWINRPEAEPACTLFCHLIGDLPDAADLHGVAPKRPRHVDVLLSARRLHDDQARSEASDSLRDAEHSYTRRGQVRPGRLLLEAFNEMVINGLTHGQHSDVDVISAACVTPLGNLQVAVFDGSSSFVDDSDIHVTLRGHAERSEANQGGYCGVVRSAKYPSSLLLMAGAATLSWNQQIRVTNTNARLPGYLAALDVEL
jgi:hypothetical protein